MDLDNGDAGAAGGGDAGAGAAGGEGGTGFFGGGAGGDAGGGGGNAGAGGNAGEGGDAGTGAAGGGEGGGDAGATPNFIEGLSTESVDGKPSLQDWAKSRGYKSIEEVVKSARDAQQAVRDTGRIKVPGEDASDAEKAAFAKAIGVPEKADDYTLPEVKGEDGKPLTDDDGNPIPIDEDRFKKITGYAHKHGIPKPALEGMLQDMLQDDLTDLATAEDLMQEKVDAVLSGFGDKKAEKQSHITAAAQDLGLTKKEQKAMLNLYGPERTFEIMAKHGARLGEDAFVQGGGNRNFGLSGAEAQKALNEKRADSAWLSKAVVPGTPENAEHDRYVAAISAAEERRLAQLNAQ